MIKLTDKQIEALKHACGEACEFNTKGKQPWHNTHIWNIKERSIIGDAYYYVAFDHGHGHIALFKGDTLVTHTCSGIIMIKDLVVYKHYMDDVSWVYVNCMETEYFQEIFPFAEEAI